MPNGDSDSEAWVTRKADNILYSKDIRFLKNYTGKYQAYGYILHFSIVFKKLILWNISYLWRIQNKDIIKRISSKEDPSIYHRD